MLNSGDPTDWKRLLPTGLMQDWRRPVGDAGAGPVEIAAFGADPGNLRMLALLPDELPPGAPLVVVLHGCTQTAAGYAAHAGWIELAQRHRFALLLPEQRRANNPNLCFDWFEPRDTARGEGEVASIRAMVAHLTQTHALDPARIFLTGLSAGGAMAGALLATYPEVFAGGAIMAGLPYGCATSVTQALDRMRHDRSRPATEWGDLVRGASAHRGRWPSVSVWHGGADATVIPANARETVKQWLDVHGLSGRPAEDRVDGIPHQVWRDAQGVVRVEAYAIPGMDHGTPIAPHAADAQQRCGSAAPFVLDVGISSSWRMAERWGLLRAAADQHPTDERPIAPRRAATPRFALPALPRVAAAPVVIGKALRAAGLMKSGD